MAAPAPPMTPLAADASLALQVPSAAPTALAPPANPASAPPPQAAPAPAQQSRVPGGNGPAGRAALVRLLRLKSPEMRRIVHAWLDRFASDQAGAVAEFVSQLLVVADVPQQAVEREDVQDREPADLVQEIVAAIAVAASEKGADFSHHWLVSKERGAARIKENFPAFWRELVAAAPYQTLLGGLLPVLSDWILALADCQFRSVRHVATVAGLQIVEGLGIQCRALREFCGTAEIQVRSAEAQGAEARLASLKTELEHTTKCTRHLITARNSIGAALLSRRTKDVDPETRRSCFEALHRWTRADVETFADPKWTRYLHFGLNDRNAQARSAVLTALREVFKADPTNAPSPALRTLAENVGPRVLARCHDVDASVSAAAIRCVTSLAARGLLAEEDYDPIVDMIWDPDAQRRTESAAFVSRFVFSEDVLDYGTGSSAPDAPHACNSSTASITRRRIHMILQFLAEYAEGQYVLVDRLVAALWRRSSCLEDWEVFAGMALPGSENSLNGEVHTALVHVMDATARLANEDAAGAQGKADNDIHAVTILDRACRALATRVPNLLLVCQSEPAAMRRASSLCRHLLKHCAIRASTGNASCGGSGAALISGAVGDATAEALRAAFLRQPDPEALEHLAEAMAYLLDLAAGVRPIVKDLASALQMRFIDLAPRLSSAGEPAQEAKDGNQQDAPPVAQSLQAVSTRLRILCKAFDVSVCDLSNFGSAVLGLLDDRAMACSEGADVAVGPQLATTLLELLALVLVRHTVAVLQPGALVACVVHDHHDEKELQLVPTAANDLCSVVAALMTTDKNQHVRTAAFVAALTLLSAWWNGTHLAAQSNGGSVEWALPLSEELATAMWAHLGQLLVDANGVSSETAIHGGVPEPGNPLQSTAFSQMFALLNCALASGEDQSGARTSDSQRVRVAIFACALVAACRHPDVLEGTLPSLVLSQALSPREDLQAVAWVLMKRLRKEAHLQPDNTASFFMVLLRAVQVVQQDAGVGVAKDLSYRLLQHVGVGKLTSPMQSGMVAALQAGVEAAISGEERNAELLDALAPWVTKHVVDDDKIKGLAAWAEQQATEATSANLAKFIAACRATAARGENGVAGEDITTPTRGAEFETPTPKNRRSGYADLDEDDAELAGAPAAAAPSRASGAKRPAPAGANKRAGRPRRAATASAQNQR